MLALFVVLSVVTVTAQEDLTEKNFPKIGLDGNYRSSSKQELENLDTRGGKDQIWDYSTITNSQEIEQVFWKPIILASAEAQNTFPNATYFQTKSTITNVTNFFSVDKNSQKQLGYNYNTDYIKFDKPIDYYPYPMKFGQKYESIFSYDYNGKAEGKFSVVYDGYGELALPDKTFENAIRLKINTATVFEDDLNDTIKTTEFQFLVRESGRLVFSLVEIQSTAIPEQKVYNYQYFVSPIISSVNEELSAKTQVYPNPSTNFIRVDVPNSVIIDYDIVDINGNIISGSNYSNMIDISDVVAGTYFVKAKLMTNEVVLKKFIKQ